MKSFIKVMKALADPNRVKIIKMLQQKRLCVCELQAALGIAQPTVSKHLRILEEADLVKWTKSGLWVDYELADGRESPYAASLLGNLRHWLDDAPDVVEVLAKLPTLHRDDICRRQPRELDTGADAIGVGA